MLLLSVGPAAAHEAVVLDDRRPSPGLRLELIELASGANPSSAVPAYRLQASGLPRGVVFDVWARDFGHGFHEIASGFRVDEFGVALSIDRDGSGHPRRLDEIALEPGPYPRGAVWEVAIASEDRALTAFATVIPRPLTARDGPCTVSLQLAARRGDRFLALGAGFGQGEMVTAELWSAGRVIRKQQRASAEGRLPPDVLSEAASGSDRSARYTVMGSFCTVTIEYEWREPVIGR